jgi:predicted esterase
MKKRYLTLLLVLTLRYATGQNYVSKADSCFKIQDYSCAATNYEQYLDKSDPESNGIAYRAAVSWGLAKDKEKTFAALKRYIKNNALNDNTFFSEQLLREECFHFLQDDARWTAMIAVVQKAEVAENERVRIGWEAAKAEAKLFETVLDVRSQLNGLDITEDIYPVLEQALRYRSPARYLTNNGIILFIRVGNEDVPFYVHVPDNYDPSVPSPALVVLHGGVKINKGYGGSELMPSIYRMTSVHIPHYAKNYIAIYPKGIHTLNWMNTEAGFDMVNQIVMHLKAFLNIDDNRIQMLGHSNGATGVFTYLLKAPTLYAGFYGMNTRPKVHIGGTFLQNGMTRHFYNFATDKDYYYPPQAVKVIDSLANSLGVSWHTQLNKGFPHWFPAMKESLEPMAQIFVDMETRVRNPYPDKIYFETDNVKYGASDWITITGLDTLSNKANWQIDPNFKITEWLDNNDFNKIVAREEMAFAYPHESGAIRAARKGNNIHIETSGVASFSVKLNREMIDYSKKMNIYLNGKKIFKKKISPDKQFTLSNFKLGLDRKLIWENDLKFVVQNRFTTLSNK